MAIDDKMKKNSKGISMKFIAKIELDHNIAQQNWLTVHRSSG